MKERIFRFKKFSVKHDRSAMKVGVDGVLIGAWTNPTGRKILDVGTGCGLIALMLAQRNEKAHIHGIDSDIDSIMEARENVDTNCLNDRITLKNISFGNFIDKVILNRSEFGMEDSYDLIVSNPPFFNSGVRNPSTPRESARHQAELSPESLIREGKKLLSENGKISLIAPSEFESDLKRIVSEEGLVINRICRVSDHPGVRFKRVMIEAANNKTDEIDVNEEELTMFESDGNPTENYRKLCKDFYLKF